MTNQFNAVGIDTSFKPFAPTCIDGYKVGHASLYPKGIDFTYGNLTPRSDRLFIGSKSQSMDWDHKVVWVGLQGVLREIHGLWQNSFFDVPKEKAIARYKRRMKAYLGDEDIMSENLAKLHDLGYLPITVLAIDEGERLNMNVPGYVIFAFGDFYWLTNYLETVMSATLWKIVCNATIAYEYRRVLDRYADETGVDRDFVMIQGHDFSFRGMSGVHDAASNIGHLMVFAGTDTMPAIDYLEDMYGADVDKDFVACSVMATEHAVTTSNILYEASLLADEFPHMTEKELRDEGEYRFIRRAITEVKPTGIISLVADSFDFWSVISKTAARLKDEILNRKPDANGFAKTVFRPDSGVPEDVICGMEVFPVEALSYYRNNTPKEVIERDFGSYAQLSREQVLVTYRGALFRAYDTDRCDQAPVGAVQEYEDYWLVPVADAPLTPEEKGAVETLWDIFNGTHTKYGYKVLHERIGLIYGDSITVARAEEILRRLKKKGFASCNVLFGIGSYTYQHNTRDTFGVAVKATACRVNGEIVELYKAPATEKDTLKKSAKGFLKVVKEGNDFKLLQEQDISVDRLMTDSGELKPVYSNGVFLNLVKFTKVRDRLLSSK